MQPPQHRKRVAVFRRAWYPFCVRTGQREARYERYSGRQKGDAARRARLDKSAGVRLHRADRLDGRKRLLFHLHSEKYHGRRLGDLRDRRRQRHRCRARDDLQRRVVGPRGQAPRLRLLGLHPLGHYDGGVRALRQRAGRRQRRSRGDALRRHGLRHVRHRQHGQRLGLFRLGHGRDRRHEPRRRGHRAEHPAHRRAHRHLRGL